jgi:uncharacterized protein YbaR (Trm112 family)
MEVISGYEGTEVGEFIEKSKEIWQKDGTKPKGAKIRYQIIIGKVNQRAILTPTVSTRAGTEILIIWNLTQDGIKKIEEEAKKVGLPVSSRPYLWLDGIPTILPNEVRKS